METVYNHDLAVCPEDAHFVCEKHTSVTSIYLLSLIKR